MVNTMNTKALETLILAADAAAEALEAIARDADSKQTADYAMHRRDALLQAIESLDSDDGDAATEHFVTSFRRRLVEHREQRVREAEALLREWAHPPRAGTAREIVANLVDRRKRTDDWLRFTKAGAPDREAEAPAAELDAASR